MRRSRHCSLLVLLLLALPVLTEAAVDHWTPLGPDGGEILSLAADPASPGTLYAGTWGAGVWRSRDSGGHWAPTPDA